MEDLTTWAGLWAGMKALALFVAVSVFTSLAWTARAVVPLMLSYLRERMMVFAKSRLDPTIMSRAAAIADPLNPAVDVMTEAKKIAANAPVAMANSGSTVEGVATALQSAVSQIRLGIAAGAQPPAGAPPPPPPAPVAVLRP